VHSLLEAHNVVVFVLLNFYLRVLKKLKLLLKVGASKEKPQVTFIANSVLVSWKMIYNGRHVNGRILIWINNMM
jgi:hypothetical protein